VEQLHNTPMTNNFNKEKFTKFASDKLKFTKPFKVQGGHYGEVEVYVHKVNFNFYNFRNGHTGIELRLELKFKQLVEPKRWGWGWNKQTAGRRRNDQIRHEINWVKNCDLSTMCKVLGLNTIYIDKITESKSKKKKI
jgi:hypothetical protein